MGFEFLQPFCGLTCCWWTFAAFTYRGVHGLMDHGKDSSLSGCVILSKTLRLCGTCDVVQRCWRSVSVLRLSHLLHTLFTWEKKKPLTASWSQLDVGKETFPALSFQLWKTGNSHDAHVAVILICKDSKKLLMVSKKKITDYDMIGTWRWNQRVKAELGFIVEEITKSLFPALQIIRVETQKYQWSNQEEIILKPVSEWLFI